MTISSTFFLNDLEHTSRLAHLFGRRLQGGECLALSGELGAGKTTFTRELSAQLGCRRLATSPTYTLFQEYPGGRLPMFHADLYRLGSEDELEDLGWEEMMDRFSDGVVVVEWADRFPSSLPQDRLALEFGYGSVDDERHLKATATGVRSKSLLTALKEEWENR